MAAAIWPIKIKKKGRVREPYRKDTDNTDTQRCCCRSYPARLGNRTKQTCVHRLSKASRQSIQNTGQRVTALAALISNSAALI
jgi:hypothetical protein